MSKPASKATLARYRARTAKLNALLAHISPVWNGNPPASIVKQLAAQIQAFHDRGMLNSSAATESLNRTASEAIELGWQVRLHAARCPLDW